MTVSTENPYARGLDKNPANFVALSPLSLIARTALVHPNQISVIQDERSFTWAETYARCRRFASALAKLKIGEGDTVAALLPNITAMYEAHFAVPMTGAVLNTLNTRLDAEAIAFMLDHGEAKVLLTDPEFANITAMAIALMKGPKPLVIDVHDPHYSGGKRVGEIEYEDFIATGDPDFIWSLPTDEWNAITLNYTSGTTGNPKGVVYHHRGAYLNAISNIVSWGMPWHSVYLWTLPMFHCNGWCFPWTMAANAGTSVCLRKVDAAKIFDLIRTHKVTHMCGAPIVYNMLISALDAKGERLERTIDGFIAGAAPPVAIIAGAERVGIRMAHVYGLTETYGPASVCAVQPGWDELPLDQRANVLRRQGVPVPLQEGIEVVDPVTLEPVPRDGETIGEIMFRGNIVMKGYLKNEKATHEAFAGGWFHTGDLAVMDPDNYVVIKDRSKDIIISGGENISSVEVEDVLYKHPSIMIAAVVAKPDPKWGEVPCAFVELREGSDTTEADVIAFCRQHLAGFKTPKQVIFGPIEKTATGKIQKFMLRKRMNSASAITS